MNNAVLNEDYLEFDEWPFPDYTESAGSDDNFENHLIMKFKCDDYFYRKQAFQKTMMYIQSQQYSENISSLLNALIFICNDSEVSLRTDLAESLITITKLCTMKENKGDYNCVKSFTVPCVIAFFHDANKQVRLASHNTIMNLIDSKLITKELFYEEIWLPLEELLVSYNPDELRIESFTLLVQISQLLDNCLEHNLLEFSREFIASNDNLRKTCASYLCTIIDKSSNNFIMEWLEIFYKLSEDTSWYVKKFCIECAISFSKKLTHEERWNNITTVYYNLLTDNKKWVTSSAFQNLGAFIATFADPRKSHLELSPDGHIINLLSPSRSSSRQSCNPDPSDSTNNAVSSEDGDIDNYNSFLFWKQPLTNNVARPASVSSVSLSIKDIDLNSVESTIRSDYGIPDLSNYDQDIVPMKLLRCYVNTIHEFSDIDTIRPCAYSLPAIMFTLGPSCWPYLRSAYMKLVQSISWKVRISLASSIQHIFQIFQFNASAVNDIIWAYKEFIKDVDEVKTGLMSNISEFYLSVPIDKYSEIFEDFKEAVHLDSAKNWRYRVTCMEQLESVIVRIDLTSSAQISQFLQILKAHWLPIIFTFVADEVYAVRISAVEVMLKTMAKLGKWKLCTSSIVGKATSIDEIDNIISEIKKKILLFSDSQNWYLRQLFLQSCIKIAQHNILSQETIDECLIPKYLDMCIHDSVPNNRMVGGQGLVSICSQDYLVKIPESSRRKMETVCNFLFIDTDRDVRQSVIKLKDLFESLSL